MKFLGTGICSILFVLGAGAIVQSGIGDGDIELTLDILSNREIFNGSHREPGGVFDDHCAFTDIVRFQGDLFVAFRESTGHVPGTNGRTTVLRSLDNGTVWERVADLRVDEYPAYDLRDPKLTITESGQLMAFTTGANYTQGNPRDRRGYASFYHPDTNAFGSLVEMQPLPGSPYQQTQSDWLWRMTWNDGMAYGIGYRASDLDSSRDSFLYASEDGLHWSLVTQVINPVSNTGETTIRFDEEDTMYLLARGTNSLAYIGKASPATNYTNISWTPLLDEDGDHRVIGGPNMIITPGGELLVAGRKLGSEGTSDGGNKTNLAQITLDGTWRDILELPSGGDTSYPGLLLEGETLYISYYSAPPEGGDPHIYLATLDLGAVNEGPDWNNINGDVNQNGVFFGDGTGPVETDDVTAFIQGWGSRNLPGPFGTLESYTHGDLNFDGRTDLKDAFAMRVLLLEHGIPSSALARLLMGVPEPGGLLLVTLILGGCCLPLLRHTRSFRAYPKSTSLDPLEGRDFFRLPPGPRIPWSPLDAIH